jgi:hypothetical protein
MPVHMKVVFTVFVLVVHSAAVFALRPGQTHRVGTWMWKLGAADPMRRALFSDNGLPRKYTWLLATLWFGLFLVVIWLLPG